MNWPRLAPLLVALSLASAQDLKITSTTLSNGMKVLVHEDHDIPNVAMYLFYRIGSRNERPGITGISHFFEHMMFNGAKKYGPKQFDVQMEKNGGSNNAYTSRDVTVYTNWFPAAALDLMFEMESDRIRDLAFDPKIIESERGVVYSERRLSVDNSPQGQLYEQLNAAAFTAHPYGWPVVGWASDIEAWTMDDLKAHFRMGYAPNNCVLVLAGDITDDRALALARRYLEPIPSQPPPPPIRTKEPEQAGERRVSVQRPAELPLLFAAYHIPRSLDPDTPVLDVLNSILTQGRSSRLYRRLVEKDQLALAVEGGHELSLDPGLYLLNIQVRQSADPARVEKALYEELDAVARAGVTAVELDKARNQLLAGLYHDLTTIAGKANLIGQYEVFFGDHRKLASAAAEIQKVVASDVQRAAAKYLTAKNRTTATLIPEAEEAAK